MEICAQLLNNDHIRVWVDTWLYEGPSEGTQALDKERIRMREQLEARLIILKQEFETGQTQLRDLERKQAYLRETLLRISGAIQVLEELLASGGNDHHTASINNNNTVEMAHGLS